MEKIRIVIADDQSLITQSFKILLEKRAKDISVVGIANDGKEAVTIFMKEKPDVILMDVRMPVMDGVQAAELIHKKDPSVRIIMLTTFDDDTYVQEAIKAGAVGYLLKDISPDELVSSIRAAMHGAVLFSAEVVEKLFLKKDVQGQSERGITKVDYTHNETISILNELSKREIEILMLLAKDYENKEIAEKLYVAEQTIKNNVSLIYTKLGVENRKEAREIRNSVRPRET